MPETATAMPSFSCRCGSSSWTMVMPVTMVGAVPVPATKRTAASTPSPAPASVTASGISNRTAIAAAPSRKRTAGARRGRSSPRVSPAAQEPPATSASMPPASDFWPSASA